MKALTKISDLKPVSFDSSLNSLTKSQQNILKMLSEHLEKNTPITREDIWHCWVKSSPEGKRTYIERDWDTQEYKSIVWTINMKSYSPYMSWFRSNLGSCILKGKLLAIPVIEI